MLRLLINYNINVIAACALKAQFVVIMSHTSYSVFIHSVININVVINSNIVCVVGTVCGHREPHRLQHVYS